MSSSNTEQSQSTLYFRRNDQISADLSTTGWISLEPSRSCSYPAPARAPNKYCDERRRRRLSWSDSARQPPHHTLPGNRGDRQGQTGWSVRRSTRDRRRQRWLHHSSSILTINHHQLYPSPELCRCSWQFFIILNLFVSFHKESFYSISWHYCQFSELSIFGPIFCIDKNLTMNWVEGQFERSWSFLNVRFGCFWIFRELHILGTKLWAGSFGLDETTEVNSINIHYIFMWETKILGSNHH